MIAAIYARTIPLAAVFAITLAACATYTAHHAQAKGPYRRDVAFGKGETITRLIRSLATMGFQFSADRPSGVITLPDVMLQPGSFDCDYLMWDGRPAYAITGALARLQFVVDGDDSRSTIRANAALGRVFYVTATGIQRAGLEHCVSTHQLEDAIVNGAENPEELERLRRPGGMPR